MTQKPSTSTTFAQAAPERELQPKTIERQAKLIERLIRRSTAAEGFDRKALLSLQDSAFGVKDNA